MTLPERARAVIASFEHGDETHRQWLRDVATPAILAALEETRREAWEEAQQCHPIPAPELSEYSIEQGSAWCAGVNAKIAAIRALIDGLNSKRAAAPPKDGT